MSLKRKGTNSALKKTNKQKPALRLPKYNHVPTLPPALQPYARISNNSMVLNTVKHILQNKSLGAFFVPGSSPLGEVHARNCRQPPRASSASAVCGKHHPASRTFRRVTRTPWLRFPPSHTTGYDKAAFQTQNVFTERGSNWFRS